MKDKSEIVAVISIVAIMSFSIISVIFLIGEIDDLKSRPEITIKDKSAEIREFYDNCAGDKISVIHLETGKTYAELTCAEYISGD